MRHLTYRGGYDHPLDTSGILSDVMDEYNRAKVKHGDNTLDGTASNDLFRLAALVEEVGEVAHELTYDSHDDDDEEIERVKALKLELIQCANVALTWASTL